MPFDGRTYDASEVARLRTALATPEQWIKGTMHSGTDAHGASRHCLAGALLKLGAWHLSDPLCRAVMQAVRRRGFIDIPVFNDDPATEHHHVLAVIDEAEAILAGDSGIVTSTRAAYAE